MAREDKILRLMEDNRKQAEAIERGARAAFSDLDVSRTCTCVGEFQRDAVGIATPVMIGRGSVPMALSCGAVGLAPRLDAAKATIVPELLSLREQLQAALAEMDAGIAPASDSYDVSRRP